MKTRLHAAGLAVLATTALLTAGTAAQAAPVYAGGSATTDLSTRGGYFSPATSYVTVKEAADGTTATVLGYGTLDCPVQFEELHVTATNVAISGDTFTAAATFDGTGAADPGTEEPNPNQVTARVTITGTLHGAKASGVLTITGTENGKACKKTQAAWNGRPYRATLPAAAKVTKVKPLSAFYGLLQGSNPLILKTRKHGDGILYGVLNIDEHCTGKPDYNDPWLIPGAAIKPDGSIFMVKVLDGSSVIYRIEIRAKATRSGLTGTVRSYSRDKNDATRRPCDSGVQRFTATL